MTAEAQSLLTLLGLIFAAVGVFLVVMVLLMRDDMKKGDEPCKK